MADKETVFKKITEISAELLEVNPKDVKLDSSFTDDLGADSLILIEVIMRVEEEFGIEVPDEEAEKLVSVGDVTRYIEESKK